MKVRASAGNEDIAVVYIGEFESGRFIECVEAVQPPIPREEKWVLLVSTMFGCPVGCRMCDAGGHYHGKLTGIEIIAQIDFLVRNRYPDGIIPAKKFKIQFARMGEPSLNMDVLDVLDQLPKLYDAPGLLPSLSTIAPIGRDKFFDRLIEIKDDRYSKGRFQFQFSIHTTDQEMRKELVPVKTWDFAKMASFGEKFHKYGDRKVTLNFALAKDMPVDPEILLEHFDPEKFLIKITPLNPTYRSEENKLSSYIDPYRDDGYQLVDDLRNSGYQVLISIGEIEENFIGSNCGQYLETHLKSIRKIKNGYTYSVEDHS